MSNIDQIDAKEGLDEVRRQLLAELATVLQDQKVPRTNGVWRALWSLQHLSGDRDSGNKLDVDCKTFLNGLLNQARSASVLSLKENASAVQRLADPGKERLLVAVTLTSYEVKHTRNDAHAMLSIENPQIVGTYDENQQRLVIDGKEGSWVVNLAGLDLAPARSVDQPSCPLKGS